MPSLPTSPPAMISRARAIGRIETVAVSDDQMNLRGRRGIDHGAAFGERHRQRLFHQHVLAGTRRHADMRGVELMRGRDIDRLDACVGAKRPRPRRKCSRIEVGGEFCRALRRADRRPRQLDPRIEAEGRQHDGEGAAEAGDAEAQFASRRGACSSAVDLENGAFARARRRA